jgi:hypothetical protein
MFSVVVLQWITSEKTRSRVAPLHTHYVLQKNSASRARGSGENGNGQILGLPEGQLPMQQSSPSIVDSVEESHECEGRARIDHLGGLPSTPSPEDNNSNCENKSNEREEADQKLQPASQKIDV